MELSNRLYEQAKRLGVCDMLTGNEDIPRLMQLLKTPQGVEFCTKNQFPTLSLFREYRGDLAESNGIFIDIDTEQNNAPKLILVGSTHAVLHYDDPTKRHEVVLMHGATAKITATNHAVVFVTGIGAECTATDNARIL